MSVALMIFFLIFNPKHICLLFLLLELLSVLLLFILMYKNVYKSKYLPFLPYSNSFQKKQNVYYLEKTYKKNNMKMKEAFKNAAVL